MLVVTTIPEARARRDEDRSEGRRVVLVPTMGFLHQGHLSLVRRARSVGDSVWVSIFVNPTQFGPGEDLERYPRDLARDLQMLEAEGVAVVFVPSVEEMYPEPARVRISFPGLDDALCGRTRPTHFSGVGLVVAKLFNIIEPEVAIFGQKDAQQALLIRRLASDLDFPIAIEIAPTVREADGLAMSSRNSYLQPSQREVAPVIHRALLLGREAVETGEADPQVVRQLMIDTIATAPAVTLDYAECVRIGDLLEPERIDSPVLLAIAAHLGATRLIDNELACPPGPTGE
jgi:pantoate--beta-alanine ligase